MNEHAYYSSNERFLSSKVNKTFGEVCSMSDQKFSEWIRALRAAIRRDWIRKGHPPKKGHTESQMVNQFQALADLDVSEFLKRNDQDLEVNCLVNSHKLLNVADSFFPNMGKMRENTSIGKAGLSQYDLLTDAKNFDRLLKFCSRRFKRDGGFQYSRRALKGCVKGQPVSARSAADWIRRLSEGGFSEHDFFLEPKVSMKRYRQTKPLTIRADQVEDLRREGFIRRRHLVHAGLKTCKSSDRFFIRVFRRDKKIFPAGYRAFQMGVVSIGTNFPAATAKFIYERYTDQLRNQKRIVVYDPSAGYAGRLTGALAATADRKIHYVGTDPNPDHYLPDFGATRYDYLAEFYSAYVLQPNYATQDIYRQGSEVIHEDAQFQQYKGKVDLVFSSPPYFVKEGYSDDKNQSCIKFPEYDEWKEHFLRPTLETAVNWLKEDRYLLWNIADTKVGQYMYPLENDSIEILESLGMVWQDTLKMVLAKQQGAGRRGKNRISTTKNFCSVGGSVYKYEPIFVFKKPGK